MIQGKYSQLVCWRSKTVTNFTGFELISILYDILGRYCYLLQRMNKSGVYRVEKNINYSITMYENPKIKIDLTAVSSERFVHWPLVGIKLNTKTIEPVCHRLRRTVYNRLYLGNAGFSSCDRKPIGREPSKKRSRTVTTLTG